MADRRPEVTFLLHASREHLTPEREAVCRETAYAHAGSFDWTYLFDQAYRHRVLGAVAVNMTAMRLFSADGLTVPRRELFRSYLLYHRQRTLALNGELARILTVLADVAPVAVRKGALLANTVYATPGVRPMADLDLLADRQDAKRVARAVETLGYTAGTLADEMTRVEPLTRRDGLFWQLHVNNLPTLYRPVSDPFVEAFVVDVCVGLFLPGSGFTVPTAELMGRARPTTLVGAPAYALAPEDMILDLAAHLYKESTTLRYMRTGKHQRLRQYWDILEYAASVGDRLDWDTLTSRAISYDVAGPLYFALAHADMLDPGAVPAAALDAVRDRAPAGVLDQYGAVDLGTPLTWDIDFLTRMFDYGSGPYLPVSKSPV